MSKLEELIAELEKATGPDRELDARIAATLEPHRFDAPGFTPIRPIPNFWLDKSEGAIRFEGGGLMDTRFFPAVTASVDAAVALVNRVLPGWHWTISNNNRRFTDQEWKGPWASISSDEFNNDVPGHEDDYFDAFVATPALSILTAVLRAKLAQEEA